MSNIALRCYVEHQAGRGQTYSPPSSDSAHSNSVVLVFDTETTVNQYQNLLFGSCGIWINGRQSELYIFYNEELLAEKDIAVIKAFGEQNNFRVLTRSQFVDDIFYPYVFTARAQCVGFNLPFDSSRLAIHFGKSRKYPNGFSLKLSEKPSHPDIIIKSLNSKAAFIEFTRPPSTKTRGEKKQPQNKGCFIDLKTATFALTNISYSLESALKDFNCELRKTTPEGHGKVTSEYLEYNVNDTLATYELYEKVLERYALYGLNKHISKLFSPASIGKAYLEKMGIRAFHTQNPDFPRPLLGNVMSTLYGGKTGLFVRKIPRRIACLDATSMYPTVYNLLGMDELLKAEKIEWCDSTIEARRLMNQVNLKDIQNKPLWKKLVTICKVKPDNDILPVRSKYGAKHTYNIGLNYIKSGDGTCLWYALPDVIASKLLSGKAPHIERAITFMAVGVQPALKEIEVLKGVRVASEEDFIKWLIEERIAIKEKATQSHDSYAREQAKLAQNILKIIANSTSYGIFVEINKEDTGAEHNVKVHSLDSFQATVSKTETHGKMFHPIVATFVTAGARLILAAAEKFVSNNGGSLVYCDTDSIMCSPEHAKAAQSFFKPMNPYDKDIEVFKIDDYEDEKGQKHPLDNIWFYGISSKRYILYDYDENTKQMKIRKYSSHGLGHLQGINLEQWWRDILTIHYQPNLKANLVEKWGKKGFAVSRLSISSANILTRFDKYNDGKPLHKQIKPYNFVTVGLGYDVDEKTGESIIPMLPFVAPMINGRANTKFPDIPFMPFIDYKTGNTYDTNTEFYWKPLSTVFEDYVDHQESKYEGEIGHLQRKHIVFNRHGINYIGKESNELETAEIIGASEENYTAYRQSIDEIIISNKDLLLKLRPRDAARFGIMKEPLQQTKRCLTSDNVMSIKRKTKQKLVELIKSQIV